MPNALYSPDMYVVAAFQWTWKFGSFHLRKKKKKNLDKYTIALDNEKYREYWQQMETRWCGYTFKPQNSVYATRKEKRLESDCLKFSGGIVGPGSGVVIAVAWVTAVIWVWVQASRELCMARVQPKKLKRCGCLWGILLVREQRGLYRLWFFSYPWLRGSMMPEAPNDYCCFQLTTI